MTSSKNFQILHLKQGDPLIKKVHPLFYELYNNFEALGHQLLPNPNGAITWVESFEKSLNKYSILIVAVENGEITGFLHGFLKLLPIYLNGGLSGNIGYTFVKPSCRGIGIGKKMVRSAKEWFKKKKCSSVEVQALSKNKEAVKFWRKMGFYDESIHFRCFTAHSE